MYNRASRGIPAIRNYAQAVEREASIAPIRGTDGVKPLADRRYKYMQILKRGENIACRLYNTDVVTFKPDGDIVIQFNGWASPTSCDFVSHVLGAGRFFMHDNMVWCEAIDKLHGDTKQFPLRSHEENIFKYPAAGQLILANPQTCITRNVNRKGANNVRKRYDNFRKYFDRTFRLREEDGAIRINKQELHDVGLMRTVNSTFYGANGDPMILEREVDEHPLKVEAGWRPDVKKFAEFQQLIEDHGVVDKSQDFYKAFLWIGMSTRGYRYRIVSKITKEEMRKVLDDVLFYLHREEVFDTTEYYGMLKRDPYTKFFS